MLIACSVCGNILIMTLEAKLTEIQGRLTPEHFPSEAAVSQGIVLPILRELNWDTDNPMVVRPEYTAGRGRADFALCDDSGNPKVFIEVKGLGGVTEKAVEQVMQYAFRVGVPIVVLTDGRTWTFYLPAEGGSSYEAKRAFKLDVLEHSPQKSSEVLQRYLEESRVVSGEAFETARMIFLLEKYRKDEPDMWEKMVDEAIAKFMRALRFLAEEIGPKSAQDNIDTDIVDYFHLLLRQKISPSSSGITAQRTKPESGGPVSTPPSSGASGSSRSGELVVLGRRYSYRSHSEAMGIVFKKLQEARPEFLQRFYEHPRNQRGGGSGRRRYLGRNQRELFGDNVKSSAEIDGGWVVSADYVRQKKKEIIQLAAEVAGLEFGRDIIITLNNEGNLENPDTVFQVGPVSRKLQTGSIRQQVFNLINEGKEVTLGTIINTIPKDKAVVALRNLVKRKIVAIK